MAAVGGFGDRGGAEQLAELVERPVAGGGRAAGVAESAETAGGTGDGAAAEPAAAVVADEVDEAALALQLEPVQGRVMVAAPALHGHTCTICMCEVQVGTRVVVFPCNRIYHAVCAAGLAAAAATSGQRSECPLCRRRQDIERERAPDDGEAAREVDAGGLGAWHN